MNEVPLHPKREVVIEFLRIPEFLHTQGVITAGTKLRLDRLMYCNDYESIYRALKGLVRIVPESTILTKTTLCFLSFREVKKPELESYRSIW